METIGYFGIDPNRSVDLILDFFISQVANHWRIFIALLSKSPICKGYERSDPTVTDPNLRVSSHTLAQLIGTKMQYYYKAGKNANEYVDLHALHMVAGLLITLDLISLPDIYPYLSPKDMDMSKEYEAWKMELDERSSEGSKKSSRHDWVSR